MALLSPRRLESQNRPSADISGVVTDQTGAAVVAAKVAFTSGSIVLTQFTDDQGEFAFSQVSAEFGWLEVSAAGFQDQIVNWRAATNRIEIVLLPAGAAEQVTVTANRASVRVIENATSVVILSTQYLAATAALTTDDILHQVAGFSLFRRTDSRTANPTTQGISLRGLGASGASRALVLADGFPLNDPFGGWVYWGRVPRMDISSIEAASGGASHLYGSDALGGVINILRKPVDQDALSLEAAYGNENTPDVSLAASKRLGQWAAGLTAGLFRTNGYIAVPSNLRGTKDTPVNSENATGDVTLERRFEDHGRVFARGSVFGESRNNGTPLQTNSTTIRELDLGGSWVSRELGSFDLHAYAGRQNLNQSFSAIFNNRDSEALTRVQRVPAQQVGFSAQWKKAFGTRQNFVAGLEESKIHGQTEELAFSSGKLNSGLTAGGREVNWGGYGEDIIRITSRWLLTLSGRVDHWQNFDAFSATQPLAPVGPIALTPFPDRSETFFSPRLALLRKVTDHVSLTASGYRSFRAPTLNELYRSFRVGNIVTQANTDLRAERLTGAEAGAIVTGWDQRILLRGNFFWNDITRPIANISITPTLRQRQNLGSTRSRGMEFEASGRMSDALTLSGGYQYTDATVTSFSVGPTLPTLVGLDIPQVPRNQFNFQVRYSKPFILVGVQGRFVGNQFDDDQNTLRLRRYFTVDATASHSLQPGVELFVAVENLLNQRYDVGRTPVLTVGPPILARAGVRLQLGAR
jgi:outer membrane receptor protein involved in Fe transport